MGTAIRSSLDHCAGDLVPDSTLSLQPFSTHDRLLCDVAQRSSHALRPFKGEW